MPPNPPRKGGFDYKIMPSGIYNRTPEMKTGKYQKTEEHIRKIGLAQKGKKITEEHKRKISEAQKGRKHFPQEKFQKGHKINLGRKCTEQTKIKISESHIGIKHSDKTKKKISEIQKGRKLSEETKRKLSKNLKGKYKGEKNWNWKGGITPENKRLRTSIKFKLWREAVFARDNWTCQKCGIKGGKLHPHHIKNFADFPELRFAINNGITLSEKIHQKFHKIYGKRNNTKKQLQEFLVLDNYGKS